jgi:hypothetical protein
VAGQMLHHRSDTDPSDDRTKNARPIPTIILSKEGCRSHPGAENQRYLLQCGEGEVRLQGSLHPEWRSAPSLPFDRW